MRLAAATVSLGLTIASISSGWSQTAPQRPQQQPGQPNVGPARPPAAPRQVPAPQQTAAPQGAHAPAYGPPRQAPPSGPMAPFVLTPAEEAEVEQVLAGWEAACEAISDVKCAFHRIDENKTFGKREEFDGEIKYKRPDKARYHAKGPQSEVQYFCDGLSLYEWNYDQKQIVQHVLPEDMRGAAIADGPLPFLFTATAAKLRNRYFLRIVTPAEQRGKSIWVEAYPRHQRDAANFSKATVIIDPQRMLPSHIQTFDTNGVDRTVHAFMDFKINDPLNWLKGDFNKPWVLPGWKSVVDDPQAEAAAQAMQPPAGPRR